MALPLPSQAAAVRAMNRRVDRNAIVGTTRSPTILIVDRDRDSLDVLMRVMADAGYRVTGVQSFEDARRALRASPDVLVTEIRLGPFNGLQLIIRGRALNPRMPAIVVTAHPDIVVRREAEQLDAIYLTKPVDPAQLRDAVAQAMGRSSSTVDD
jgi:DNA-binding NtrC family response regulator